MTRPGASDSQIATMPPMRPFVIGTAGHVDHGKSTLVKALTGIDPDRLAEEKARAMTIDLGFAWLTLPGGQSVSVVDVPGHERFIKNMLAGVGGIDAALLVVAADEGPMPQTVEHLAILDLLGVDRGVIVLTKADAVEADWLDLVREEVRERVSTTTLADAPIVAVSALTGDGLPALLETLEAVLASAPGTSWRRRAAVAGRPRLLRRRVRHRRHRHAERRRDRHRETSSGSTPAIAGRACGDCKATRRRSPARCRAGARRSTSPESPPRRSSAATCWPRPGLMTPSQRLDARLRLLPDAPVALKQNDEVDFFTGAAELPARITLLDRERLDPGESAWVQFRFRAPLAVLRNDRFIVRRPSPSETLGGGEIIDPNPPRHRRFRPGDDRGAGDAGRRRAGRDPAPGARATTDRDQGAHGRGRGTLRRAGRRRARAAHRGGRRGRAGWTRASGGSNRFRDRNLASGNRSPSRSARMLRSYHASQPLRPGLAREEARRRLGITQPRLFDDLIATIAERRGADRRRRNAPLAGVPHDTRPGPAGSGRRSIWPPSGRSPTPRPVPTSMGSTRRRSPRWNIWERSTKIADGVYFAPEAWDALVQGTLAFIDSNGSMTLSQFRDHFGTSRKYAQAALEYLDQLKYTRRVGDDRVRGPRRPGAA